MTTLKAHIIYGLPLLPAVVDGWKEYKNAGYSLGEDHIFKDMGLNDDDMELVPENFGFTVLTDANRDDVGFLGLCFKTMYPREYNRPVDFVPVIDKEQQLTAEKMCRHLPTGVLRYYAGLSIEVGVYIIWQHD